MAIDFPEGKTRKRGMVTFAVLERGLRGHHTISTGVHRRDAMKAKIDGNGQRDPEMTLGEVAHRNHDGDGIIPSRPWLSIFFSKRKRIAQHVRNQYHFHLKKAARGNANVSRVRKDHRRAAEDVGKNMEADVRQGLADQLFGLVRNAPRTIEQKGFDHPLVDTGQLLEANKSRVKKGG